MKQIVITIVVGLIVALVSFGCGSTNQLATETIYDATAQIKAAKAADAQNLATQELADAEQMLARSEELLNAGQDTEAYRLGMRAQLKARFAEAVAIVNQLEIEASGAEEALELKLRAAEAAHRDLERAEQELQALQSAPED